MNANAAPAGYDTIVLGLGAVGSAAAYHLARRGRRVLGLDRFAPPHTYGSSHGGSRIIRKAYFEGAMYVPLLDRAYVLWRELEREADTTLLHLTGGLMIGGKDSTLIRGARESAEAHGIPHELLPAGTVQARFPAFRLPDDHVALWEPEAGWLDPEACIRAHLDAARRHGADLHVDEPAIAWHADAEGVEVTTGRAAYRARTLAVCAGGWMKELVPDLDLLLRVERQVNGWFRPKADARVLAPERCPVYLWEYAPGFLLYGFPDLGRGVKAGLHHHGVCVDHPDALQRDVEAGDVEALRGVLRRLLPGADGPLVHAATCFYTNTPDEHYAIGRHPRDARVVVASACSGHGFKASSAVGEAVADLVEGGPAHVDLAPFDPAHRRA